MTHIKHLKRHIPDLLSRKILDLGCGKGGDLISFVEGGGDAVGLEYNPLYIEEAQKAARSRGVSVTIIQGSGENMLFENEQFGFINMSEVIEHVKDPKRVMQEAGRILKQGGVVYVSVPSRFSILDTHYHLFFINWMPRSWSQRMLGFFGKEKKTDGLSGLQRLDEMHYFTFSGAKKFFEYIGFETRDMRVERIKKEYPFFIRPFALGLYYALRPWWLKTFHLLLKKRNDKEEV